MSRLTRGHGILYHVKYVAVKSLAPFPCRHRLPLPKVICQVADPSRPRVKRCGAEATMRSYLQHLPPLLLHRLIDELGFVDEPRMLMQMVLAVQ